MTPPPSRRSLAEAAGAASASKPAAKQSAASKASSAAGRSRHIIALGALVIVFGGILLWMNRPEGDGLTEAERQQYSTPPPEPEPAPLVPGVPAEQQKPSTEDAPPVPA